MMNMRTALTRFFLVQTVFILALTFLIVSAPARTTSQDDSAAVYKAKCAMCHGATAEKKFDATKPDAELTDIVLKGKKAEKPPNMPAFAEKGITAEQAAALVGLMKSQKH
jgi:mono/diheme cytochrome c family protein